MIENLHHHLYLVAMGLVVIGWLALILFPRWPRVNLWFSGLMIPFLLCLICIILLATFWLRPPAAKFSAFLTLEGVYAVFADPRALLAGWIHMLATGLVAGAWMARKAAQIRMPYLLLLLCLVLTFVFAGLGFVLFVTIVAMGKGWSEIAKFEGAPPINASPVSSEPEGRMID